MWKRRPRGNPAVKYSPDRVEEEFERMVEGLADDPDISISAAESRALNLRPAAIPTREKELARRLDEDRRRRVRRATAAGVVIGVVVSAGPALNLLLWPDRPAEDIPPVVDITPPSSTPPTISPTQ